jgi:hypothetical protein
MFAEGTGNVLWFSCNGIPLNSKRKAGGPQVYQHKLTELSIDPTENSRGVNITLK